MCGFMAAVFSLDRLGQRMEQEQKHFLRFLDRLNIVAGILRLKPGEQDTQQPHVEDEIYFVAEGDGFLRVKDQDFPVRRGSVFFVPALLPHHFHSNSTELQVLYGFLPTPSTG